MDKRPSPTPTRSPVSDPLLDTGQSKVPTGNNVWTSNGPEGGEVRALAIDPQTPSTVYAGTGGGVFKSTNGGASWSVINSGPTFAYYNPVQALAIDPQTPSTVYAGIPGSGVFKSTNGGASWSAINIGITDTLIWVLAIDLQTPSTLYVTTNNGGVFKSTNGGASWSAINSGLANNYVRALAIDPQTPRDRKSVV